MRLPKALGLVSALALAVAAASAVADDQHGRDSRDSHQVRTATPIKYVVVIFQENVSFDHCFGTYPKALNLSGETPFTASKNTPKVNNLASPLDVNKNFKLLAGVDLLNNNPNSNPANPAFPNNGKSNGPGASNPFRLSPSQALTGSGTQRRPRGKRVQQPADGRLPGLCRKREHRRQGVGDGVLTRQHRHRVVELRPTLRVER